MPGPLLNEVEPERKIEKWLRTYAKKRRAGAGDAFKLHPATRRMLQDEVARRAPKPAGSADAFSLWKWLRPRWVLPLGFALILCLGVALFWPAPPKPEAKFQTAETQRNLRQLDAAAQIAAANNRDKRPAPAGAPAKPPAFTPVLADNFSGLQSTNPPAFSPEGKSSRVAPPVEPVAIASRRGEFSGPTQAGQPALALAGNAPNQNVNEASAPITVVAAPPVAEPAEIAGTINRTPSLVPGAGAGAVVPEQFAPGAAAGELRAVRAAAAPSPATFKSELAADALQAGLNNSQQFVQVAAKKNAPVLQSFELRQNGDQLSVVDRDGSIYHGTLQPVEMTDLSRSRLVEKPGASQLQQKDFGAVGNAPSSAQNFIFRVSGANRSLKQNVVFAGNLVEMTNVTANAAQTFGGGGAAGGQSKSASANVVQQPLFSNSRITGMVTIDDTNRMEITALPVNP